MFSFLGVVKIWLGVIIFASYREQQYGLRHGSAIRFLGFSGRMPHALPLLKGSAVIELRAVAPGDLAPLMVLAVWVSFG